MSLLLFILNFLPWAGCCGLLLYVGRLRNQYRRENVVRTVNALRNTVLVDAIELPKPDDLRWTNKKATVTFYRDYKKETHEAPSMTLPPVQVTGHADLKSGMNGVYINGQSVDSPAMRKYAASVWATQRSRAVREALEKGETP
jgi:hypothetical protein